MLASVNVSAAHHHNLFPAAQLPDEFLPTLAQERVAAGDGKLIDVDVPLLLELAQGIQHPKQVA
jgi:hypothetical protein